MAAKLHFVFVLLIAVCSSFRIDPRYVNVTDVDVDSERIEFKVSLIFPDAALPIAPATEKAAIKRSTREPPTVKESSRFKVVCNFWNRGLNHQDNRKFTPENIDENLCTHIVYNSAKLGSVTYAIKVENEDVDIDMVYYRRVTEFKKKGIPVLISVGATDERRDGYRAEQHKHTKYVQLVRNATARTRFVASAVEFIEEHNFDGLELHWEHPCWQHCTDDDKNGLTDLMRELSEALKPRGLLLTLFVSSLGDVIPLAYDVTELSKYVDWFSVMSYNYNGNWNQHTGLFASNSDTFFSMASWIQRGAPSRKILMGLSMRGATFLLTNADANSVGSPATRGGGKSGGYLSFYEILKEVGNRYTVRHDDPRGTYAYLRNDWISYSDVTDIERKADKIRKMNLGGAMISALDEDDFLGGYCGKYPLVTAVSKFLHDANVNLENCT